MSEAVFKERLQAKVDWADIALKNSGEFNSYGIRNLCGPIFDAAREALAAPPAVPCAECGSIRGSSRGERRASRPRQEQGPKGKQCVKSTNINDGSIPSGGTSLMNAASPQRRHALDCISMQSRDVYQVERLRRFSEVSLESASQVRRVTNALMEEPDYEGRRNIQFTRQVPRYFATVAAAREYSVEHLQVFDCEIGGVDRGRHVVLLSVRAKRKASIGSARYMAAETFSLRSIMDDSK